MRLAFAPEETIAGVSDGLRAGRLSCVAVVERCLARIDEREGEVRAWVRVDREGALRRAEELDAERTVGRWQGPLHGIPVGIKDIVDVAGWPTAAGSAWFACGVAACDAPIVVRLRAAGAIILGKTVTTQFASFDPPVTRNPWSLAHTPGGSSSGSAATVASGMCLAAVGSQTGGSITRPASFCGVAGFKPSYGMLDVSGIVPLAPSMDHPGPIARTVGDLHVMLSVMAGRPGSELTMPNRPPRIGRLRGLFDAQANAGTLAALEAALESLRAAGACVEDVTLPPGFHDVIRCHGMLMSCEAAAFHERRLAELPDDYLPRIRSLIEAGLSMPAPDYIRCRQHQAALKQDMRTAFADVDLLACSATVGPACDASSTGDPVFNSPWSYTGLPTVSFPITLADNGLPLSIQLIGPHGGDGDLLQRAAWCEAAVRGVPV